MIAQTDKYYQIKILEDHPQIRNREVRILLKFLFN